MTVRQKKVARQDAQQKKGNIVTRRRIERREKEGWAQEGKRRKPLRNEGSRALGLWKDIL